LLINRTVQCYGRKGVGERIETQPVRYYCNRRSIFACFLRMLSSVMQIGF
jgi:hypothetical protein